MPDLQQIRDVENRLNILKTQRDSNEITSGEYADQAASLRFEDTETGEEWWLDPVDEQWYVALVGSGDFELANPQPGTTEVTPMPPVAEVKRGRPVDEPVSPRPNESSEIPHFKKEVPKPQEERMGDSSSQSPSDLTEEARLQKFIMPVSIVGIILATTLLCVFSWQPLFTFINRSDTPTPTYIVTVSEITPLPSPSFTPFPTETYTPLPTHTATALPSDTPTATQTPSATLVPTNTLEPMTATSQPTNTPLSPTTTPTFTPNPNSIRENQSSFNGKLAYSYFDQTKQTYVIEIVELSDIDNPFLKIEQASQPALSSDGLKLAYHSWDSKGVTPAKGIGLYYISLASPDAPGQISRFQESHRPQWGPNNQDKVFTFIQKEDKQVRFSDEHTGMTIANGYALSAAWTPGSRLVFFASQGNRCGLAIANTNGTGFEFLTDGTQFYAPAVSPNGTQVAYVTDTDGNWDVWVMNIDRSNQQRLTSQAGKDGIPTWSPDGDYIAYASQQNGGWEIRVVTPNKTYDQKLFKLPGSLEGRVPEIPDHAQPGWLFESLSWVH